MLCSKCGQAADPPANDEPEQEGAVEIDDNALLSEGNDNGCYVQAWVWVNFAGTRFDKEEHETD